MRVCLVTLVCLFVAACGASPALDVSALPRHHPPTREAVDPGFAPALSFEPSAAYVRGVATGELPVGTWVSGVPGPSWPATEGAPVLALGQVVERSSDWARLELAAVVDALRPDALRAVVVDTRAGLPSVTKRLVRTVAAGDHVGVPVGSVDLVTGEEVYGVLPHGLRNGGRLASRLTGLARLEVVDPNASNVVSLAGTPPVAGDYLILLGPSASKPLRVQVLVTALGDDANAVGRRDAVMQGVDRIVQRWGIAGVEVLAEPASHTRTTARQRLNGRQEDSLATLVFSADDLVYVDSQAGRVLGHDGSAWQPAPVQKLDVDGLAAWVVVGALEMRGDDALAAFVVEQALRAGNEAAWAAWGPLLARLYRQLWRADWSLEVVLTLESMAAETNEAPLWGAVLEADHVRSVPTLDRAHHAFEAARLGGVAPAPGAMRGAIRYLEASHRWADADRLRAESVERTVPDPVSQFDRVIDGLRATLSRDEPAEAVVFEAALASATELGPAAELEVRALARLAELQQQRQVTRGLLDVAQHADELGAPAVAFEILTAAAQVVARAHGPLADRLLLEAARYAEAARRSLWTLAILTELEEFRLARGGQPIDGELGWRYLTLLATMDRREQLGRRALASGRAAVDDTSARDALELARELFVAIGDDLNGAVASLSLARLEIRAARFDAARDELARAQGFEASVRDPALSSLRRDIEEELRQREQFAEQPVESGASEPPPPTAPASPEAAGPVP